MRIKLADGAANGDIEYADRLRHRRREVEARLRAAGARVDSIEDINEYTIAATLDYDGELKHASRLRRVGAGCRGAVGRLGARDHQGPR